MAQKRANILSNEVNSAMTLASSEPTATAAATDVISELVGIESGTPLAELRGQRPEAMLHAQGSYRALFDPEENTGLSAVERFAVALRVAVHHAASEASAHYRRRLVEAGASPELVAAASGSESGAAETHQGRVSERLGALLRHADLLSTHPVDAEADDLQALADASLATEEIVTLSQAIAFVSFQARVIRALQLIGGETAARASESDAAHASRAGAGGENRAARGASDPPSIAIGSPPTRKPAEIVRPAGPLDSPTAFTVRQLAWEPWLRPLEPADATPRQAVALEAIRGNSPYFRLLARDADVLRERTATDRGIFYTPGGAPRAERELAAAATSRLNGCIYCASVHARLSAQLSKRHDDIDRVLLKGVEPGTDLELDDRWQAIVDASVALARTPSTATIGHVARLREVGLGELEILDVLQAAAFFSWANRLMLSLGEPNFPESTEA